VRKGQPLCVVETAKASIEIDAPAAGILVQLYPAGVEVELGRAIASVAETAEEASAAREARERKAPEPAQQPEGRRATRKAVELAEHHGIDLDAVEKQGFVTAEDVEALVRAAADEGAGGGLLAGISTENVTLPASFHEDESVGALDPAFLDSLRADPEAFRSLSGEEKLRAYAGNGARIGSNVVLDEGVLIVAPRILLDDDVRVGPGATVRCEDVFAVGELTHVAQNLEVTCRRAFLGANVHAGRSIRIGGGGHRDPWSIAAIGDLAFVGDEVFVNTARPVLIGRETFVTQRSMLVTHNIGHSLLEGFENRFGAVVLEDRAQLGLGSVVYAGCRIGREAIVASSSYVVSDIPAGRIAIGVPAAVAGPSRRSLARGRQAELARRMLEELRELLELKGHAVSAADWGGLELRTEDGPATVLFAEKVDAGFEPPVTEGEVVVLTLSFGGTEPGGYAVLDLLGRTVHGEGGVVLDSVREFCRKRGIRFEPGPWRYRGGFV
jgi:acetyltransferase-like isoleucine patch superfamily enzyme